MKKNNRKALLLLSSALAGVTMLAAVGVMQETQTASAAQTGVFEMMDGAGLRASEPTGIRFIAKFDKSYYDMITTTAADLHVAIVPYTYYVAYEASGETDFYPWLSANYDTYLDLTIPDAKIYQDGGYYYANAVMSNVRMNNYNRDFVGVAYIKDGDTYTEVAISESKNARSVMEVAEKAYRDPEDGVQFKDFLEETIEKGIYSAYGVKYNAQTNEYVYEGNTYAYSELSSVVNVETLQMESGSVSVMLNQTLQLQPKVTYENGASYNQELTAAWSSSDTSVATVDQNGVVTGRKVGEAKIYVKALGGRIDGFITVTVKEKDTVAVSEDVVFMAQGDAGKWAYNTGNATVDLTGVPFDLNDVEKITCNGEEIAFTVSGNNVTLTDAPGGDQLYTFETAEADYVIGGCIYGLAISTVEELEEWRTSESYWYAVLLNDIDYEGATLNGGANVLGTLDGRGHQIKNFTTANGFINRLYAAESAIKNVYFKNVTQDCSGWTGGIDRGVLGQWNNGTLENVYLQVHTTN
ncbi:MAG: Ig-like domain-containing protein, partial [Clostridia bacterium]|nr:Ig-like domain-containing protein [Clostridia bacterium]